MKSHGSIRLHTAFYLASCFAAFLVLAPISNVCGQVATEAATTDDATTDEATSDEVIIEIADEDKATNNKVEASDDDDTATENDEESAAPAPDEDIEEYFELLKVFADTIDQVDRNYVKNLSRRELVEAAIEGVLSKLDQYSNYIPPDEIEGFRTDVESEFGGIGIRVSSERNFLKVISPLVGSPAYRAGILSGDLIIAIAGESTKGMSLDDAVKKMKGKIGTPITLSVRHPFSGVTEDISVQREIVTLDTVMGVRRGVKDGWDFMLNSDEKIGYIRVTAFSRQTNTDLRTALTQLIDQGLRGLVLDLRFNPGGLLSSAVEVSDTFLSEGRIVSTEGRNTPKRVWDAEEKGTFDGFEIAVLVNKYSASASEIVAACLQDHGKCVVIGQRTWGKGSVQNIIELEAGRSALKLTTASYHRPSGKNIHRFDGASEDDDWGVRPNDTYEEALSEAETSALWMQLRDSDIVKSQNQTQNVGVGQFVDRQLQKALDYLSQKMAKR